MPCPLKLALKPKIPRISKAYSEVGGAPAKTVPRKQRLLVK